MKYYIKGTYGNFTNELIFSEEDNNIMYFDTFEEVKEAMQLYGLQTCLIKKEENK